MISPDIVATLLPVIEALEGLGVTYHIGGSLASSAHGTPRSTRDIDVIADLGPEHAGPLVAMLEPTYYVDEDAVREAIRRRGSFNVIHLGTMLKVDVFASQRHPFDQSVLARARCEKLGDTQDAPDVFVASAEDIVLRKLQWFRAAGESSERQWEDVLGVLTVRKGSLDTAYMQEWAERLGILDLLERARGEAGEVL